MGWWKKIWTDQAEDWIFDYLSASQVPDKLARVAVASNSGYLSVFLRSFRVVNVRKGISKFYGTVHSFIAVPHISGKPAKFHVLTTPSSLSEIDAENIDRIINMNHRLLGPIPYRGGDVEIEVGLFSVESANLVKSFLTVLEGMSQAAGVSYINAALPFVGPILQGVDLLTGAGGASILEIGLARPFAMIETGTMIVIRAPKGSINISDYQLDEDFKLIAKDGQSLKDYPYIVVAIEAQPDRPDWFNIPELAAAYAELMDEVRKGKYQPTMEALAVFKRVAITCPDLFTKHAVNLAKEVEEQVNGALGYVPTAVAKTTLKPLKEFDPFNNQG
jgi:hypothetical protein